MSPHPGWASNQIFDLYPKAHKIHNPKEEKKKKSAKQQMENYNPKPANYISLTILISTNLSHCSVEKQ